MQDRAVITQHVAQAQDPRKQEEVAAAAIASYVKAWDVDKAEGGKRIAVEIEASEVLRLQPLLLNRLYRIVTGMDGGDADPTEESSEVDERAAQELDRALGGQSPPVERERAEVKN
jgi:hypothetical protein